MHADLSRDTFRPDRRYAAVLASRAGSNSTRTPTNRQRSSCTGPGPPPPT
ncbi:hypothetical protein NKH18_40985 [Streptomyces sp. M10(2022)]